MSGVILDTPSKHARQLKKAMTFVQPYSQSPISYQEEQINSINKLKRSSSKVLIATPSNATTSLSQMNEPSSVTFFSKRGHHFQYQYNSVENKKDKISQNSPLLSYLSESKQSEGMSTPYQQKSYDSNKQIKKSSPIDFSRFMKNEIISSCSSHHKQKKCINKQNLLEQITSYGLLNKLSLVEQKDNQHKNNIAHSSTPLNKINKGNQPRNIQPFSPSIHNAVAMASPSNSGRKSFPLLPQNTKQDQGLIPLSKVSHTNFNTTFTDKIYSGNQIKSIQTDQQCFAELKDKLFQIKRAFQDNVDKELSYSTSPMLNLLQKKGYKPQTLSFYFSKLIENTILHYNYQTNTPNSLASNSIQKNNLITRQHSFKLEGDFGSDCTHKNIMILNNVNNNATNIQSVYNQNSSTSNFSFEKDIYSQSTAPQSLIFGKNGKIFATPRDSSNTEKNKKIDDNLSHIPSLPHIPIINDPIYHKSSPVIPLSRDFNPLFHYSNSVDEISLEEDIVEDDPMNNSIEYIHAPLRKRAETELNPTLITHGQLNKTFNLFFKIPSQVYDELIQILLQILKKNIKSQVEINNLIKFLNEQKKEYTPQNLIEEFGSVDRLLSTIRTLFTTLKSEGIFSSYLDNCKDFDDETLLEFINCLVSFDKTKLEYYSNIFNSKAKISFVEFFFFKQFIHQSLMEIFDKEERTSLLPLIMECIEKVRYIFLIQRENHILDDSVLLAKIKQEVQMKMYITCPPEFFEEYIAGKIQVMNLQNSQTPIKRGSVRVFHAISNQQTQNQSKPIKKFHLFNKNDGRENNNFLKYIESLPFKIHNNHQILNEKQEQNRNKIEHSHKENAQMHLQQIASPFRDTLQDQFKINKRYSIASGLIQTPKKAVSNIVQYSKPPPQDNHLIINKLAKVQYYEELSQFIFDKILIEQDLKELLAGLNKRFMKMDLKVLDFLWRNIEEILHSNKVLLDIVQDIKVRFFKLKLSLIPNFSSLYESEEFRQSLQSNFAQIIEHNFKKQKKKLIYFKFTPIFDYILYNYLSLNDIFTTSDITFSLSITDSEEIIIKLFKNSVKETFLNLLPEEIQSIMDYQESFFI